MAYDNSEYNYPPYSHERSGVVAFKTQLPSDDYPTSPYPTTFKGKHRDGMDSGLMDLSRENCQYCQNDPPAGTKCMYCGRE